ncbi:MAG: glycoside hydrolase family 16 protein, partial [Acidimicrobiaceae bacterium]|nr:glycoside hydrolase family 16 protein [Acidimicrobiaceae bacterium]
MAPPGPQSLAGYRQTYVTDFMGTALPSGWSAFAGNPSGDPGSQWAIDHVSVGGGLLQLSTYQDPRYANNWVSGGLCQCALAQTYGAYFVRSRMTGPGPTQVELLWPLSGWPPEVDFNETYGPSNLTIATDHFDSTNQQIHNNLNIDMTQWHTWGVVWTPTSLTYVVDGRIWGSVTGTVEIPSQPLALHIQQQTWCSSGWACP